MSKEPLIVIGGGAAGMMAAGRAGAMGERVILFEKNRNLGRKILITGKGRCNVTNSGDINKFIANYGDNGQFLYSSFNRFFNNDLLEFFKGYGVALKVERGGRVFPESDDAADIVKALAAYIKEGNVEILYEKEVKSIAVKKGRILGVETSAGRSAASQVIIATGGKSYPGTGSIGDGYKWAMELGHTLIPPKPALVPLNVKEGWVKELQGLALKNVEASLYMGDKFLGKEFGEMLFTHFGVSGPIILTLSRKVAINNSSAGFTLKINLKPALDEETLDLRLQKDFIKFQRRQLKNSLNELLPSSLIPVIINLSGISEDKYVHQITREERQRILSALTGMELTILGPRSLAEAIVTAGGVSLKEINPRTMESKLVKGLYFAGEVLDVDGFTGGYNLQAAFSTGFSAGESAAKASQAGLSGDGS